MEICFNGKSYLGWQIQKDFSPTVQEKLNNALKKIYKVSEVKTTGSGRTDTGVHATSLFVAFSAPFDIPMKALVRALNSHLPEDIRAINASEVSDDFRPTNDARKKEYRYFFTNLETHCPFFTQNLANISYPLNYDQMQKACELFVGKYDFLSFHCKGSDPKTTVREIFTCEINKEVGSMGGILPDHFVIRIEGSGFLKQMVRSIVGVIWSVGRGKLTLEQVQSELVNPTGKHLAAIAPPEGLYKFSVTYS